MIIAIVVTFLSIGNFSTSLVYVIVFLVIGGAIGAFIAFKNSNDCNAGISCRFS